jgi:hypothetical protein
MTISYGPTRIVGFTEERQGRWRF